MRKQFYEKALPSQGVYCAAEIKPNAGVIHQFFDTRDELVAYLDDVSDGPINVFVALSTFKSWTRRADNVAYTRSFFVDLDVDPEDDKKYSSKDEAMAALQDFVSSVQLPPPVVVDSGGGIHAYWLFQQDIPLDEWKPYAEKFKTFCREHIKIDPVVTADAARIMRSPDTLNCKFDPPVRTQVVDGPMYEYDFEAFKDFLGPLDVSENDPLANVKRGLDDDTLKIAKLDNFEKVFQIIAEKSLNDEGCAQIKHVLVNSATLSEPLWHSGLSIARHCSDWETAIHLMSEDYSGYSPEQTIRKANETLGKPHSCDTFADRNPGGCDGCPFRGKITNPLNIGRRLIEATAPEEVSEEDAVRQNEDPEAVPVFPAFLKPYVRGVNGGVYFLPTPKRDEEGKVIQEDPICLSLNDLYPVKRIYHKSMGETLVVRYVLPKDPLREFLLPLRAVATRDEMLKILSDAGLLVLKDAVAKMQDYWSKWAMYLQNKDGAEQMRMQMGWTENMDSFVIGTQELTCDGEIRKAAASPMVRNVSKLLVPSGDYGKWKTSANFLNTPGFELHAFGMMCGFGSPFMCFTPTSGVCVSFTSNGSSHGKTSAMYAGLSVWGHPKELSVLEGNSTDNAYIGRYLNLKNILYGIDEAGSIDGEELSRLIHRVSQGKAKMRMQSSQNSERELEETASLIAIFTNNTPLYDKLTQFKGSPDGEVARLVEFVLQKPAALTTEVGIAMFNPFRMNYGWAGIDLIKHYFKVGDEYTKSLLQKWALRFRKDFGDNSVYRFWESLISTSFGGAELAIEAGIVDLDLERIYLKVIGDMLAIRDGTKRSSPEEYKSLIGEFCDKHGHNFLILNDGKVASEPRFELMGRTEVDEAMRYIPKSIFKKFLGEKQISFREFEMAMRAQGILTFEDKKRLGTGWKPGRSAPGVAVYGFKTDPKELLDDGQD